MQSRAVQRGAAKYARAGGAGAHTHMLRAASCEQRIRIRIRIRTNKSALPLLAPAEAGGARVELGATARSLPPSPGDAKTRLPRRVPAAAAPVARSLCSCSCRRIYCAVQRFAPMHHCHSVFAGVAVDGRNKKILRGEGGNVSGEVASLIRCVAGGVAAGAVDGSADARRK